MRVAAFVAAIFLVALLSLVSLSRTQGEGADVRIAQLDCNSNPEVVTIKNVGDAAQDLNGWKLRSDPVTNAAQVFDLSQVVSLDPGEEASIFSGSNAPPTDPALGQYRWALSYKFRNDDVTDFVQIVDAQTAVIDQLNCGQQPSLPTPTPTPTPEANVVPICESIFLSVPPLTFDLPCWDPDSGPQDLTCEIVSPPQNGIITASDCSATYYNAGYVGYDRFEFRAYDGADYSNIATADIAVVPPTPTPTPTPTPPTVVKGDMDCDNDVDGVDALLIMRHVVALPVNLPPGCPPVGDIDCDDDVDGVDALLIMRHVVVLPVNLPPGCPPIGESPSPTPTLQIHHIDVEQGDAALIVSPNGQLAMVDDGTWIGCSSTVGYLQQLGITSIDYHFASHYHADHIGCLDDMAAAGIDVAVACYDRGSSYEGGTFSDYEATCGGKRQTLSKGQVITLDQGAAIPVTITVVELDGAGIATSDENALSLVLKLTYGSFDEALAGDLTGETPDIESVVAPQVGDVEVYKVNHHGSKYSSNDDWLDATAPEVGIISVGNNSYGHPTLEALTRLHNHGVKTYWTNVGSGATPDPAWDRVVGDVVIEAEPGLGGAFTVSGEGFTDTYVNQ